MGKETEIAWTDATWHAVWGPGAEYRRFGSKHWEAPFIWDAEAQRAGVRRRVFCASMADVFDERASVHDQQRLWDTIGATPFLDWLLLTKRPQNAKAMLPAQWRKTPLRNVWIGTTVEDQKRAEERVPLLLEIPAAIRFLSVEPMLGPVDLRPWLPLRMQTNGWNGPKHIHTLPAVGGLRGLDWVICGGESGGGARPFNLAWARDLRGQCSDAGVAFFCKQLGARPKNPASPEEMARAPACDCGPGQHSPGCVFSDRPLRLKDAKGGDMAEWPADLRVREFPEARL